MRTHTHNDARVLTALSALLLAEGPSPLPPAAARVAQLALRHGGLGLRSAALHADAAYWASGAAVVRVRDAPLVNSLVQTLAVSSSARLCKTLRRPPMPLLRLALRFRGGLTCLGIALHLLRTMPTLMTPMSYIGAGNAVLLASSMIVPRPSTAAPSGLRSLHSSTHSPALSPAHRPPCRPRARPRLCALPGPAYPSLAAPSASCFCTMPVWASARCCG